MISFLASRQHLVSTIEDLGNPFEEDGTGLLVLDIETTYQWKLFKLHDELAKNNLKAFTKEYLIGRTKSIDVIHQNKQKIFVSAAKKNVKKGKQQLVSLKSDVGLCSRLYIGCSTTDGW